MSIKEFLRQLSQAHGVSGYEHAVRDLVSERFRPYADEIAVTPMGSVIALQRGTRADKTPAPQVLVEAHMDEIGLMVTDIDHGFIRFTHVGGVDARVLVAQEVVVQGKETLRGIIGARPPHVLTAAERDQVIPMSDLWIDVGLSETRVRDLVQPGDLVTLARQVTALKNDLVAGKAFDDRCGVVCVAETLELLATMRHPWDVYAVANAQEEVGSRGAITSTFQINPAVAIALDATYADQPNMSEINVVPLNQGMGIATGPNIHPLIHEKLTEIAKAHEIPYRVTAYTGTTSTDAWAMQVVREGIPTGLIDIPVRYMHTSVETLSLTDLERVSRLLALFCAALDDQFLKQLRGEPVAEQPAQASEKPKAKNVTRKAARKRK